MHIHIYISPDLRYQRLTHSLTQPKQKAQPGLAPGRSCIFPTLAGIARTRVWGHARLGSYGTIRYGNSTAQHSTARYGAVRYTFPAEDGTCHTYILPTSYIHTPISTTRNSLADKIKRRRHDVDCE